MRVRDVTIKNFRGINIHINDMQETSLIIGQNDSGKSNICYAIYKALDLKNRRKPLYLHDSTYENGENILIELTLTTGGLTNDQRGEIGRYIHSDEKGEYIKVRIDYEFMEDIQEYELKYGLGDPNGDYEEMNGMISTPLDRILSVMYISASYNIDQNKKDYFKEKERMAKLEDKGFSSSVKEVIEALDNTIKNDDLVKDIRDEISNYEAFNSLFDGIKVDIYSNVKFDKMFASLDIYTYNNGGVRLGNVGDGRSKILSTVLQTKLLDREKMNIMICEEPENHLYVLLQKSFLKSLQNMNMSQIITTTHSPHIVDLEKIGFIMKVDKNTNDDGDKVVHKYNVRNEDFKKYGYLINSEVAEMLYYDKVVLVEGFSEKYFYNLLAVKSENFREYLSKNKIGIFCVGGVSFKVIKEMLEKMGIEVFIKTDNDFYGVRGNVNLKQYAGIKRALQYLSHDNINNLMSTLDLEIEDEPLSDKISAIKAELTLNNGSALDQEKIEEICEILIEDNIIMSTHHDGFERDFIEYIQVGNEDREIEIMSELNKSKLINLHKFIDDENIDLDVKATNVDSPLLAFCRGILDD